MLHTLLVPAYAVYWKTTQFAADHWIVATQCYV